MLYRRLIIRQKKIHPHSWLGRNHVVCVVVDGGVVPEQSILIIHIIMAGGVFFIFAFMLKDQCAYTKYQFPDCNI